MKTIKGMIAVTIVIIVLLTTSIPVFAFSENESRSVESFFIESTMLKGNGSSYGLENAPTRMEGIIILIRLLGKEAEAQQMQSLPCRFADVPTWAIGYANYAYAENISKGISDTLFGTTGKMTAQQYNTLLLRTIGYNDSNGDFRWNTAVSKAEELSILPSDMAAQYVRNTQYTKGDLLETSFCFLEANFKDADQTLIGELIENDVVSDQLAEKYGLAVEGWDSLTTGFGEEDYLNFQIKDGKLYLSGTSENKNKAWLLVQINDVDTGEKKVDAGGRIGDNNQYDINLSLTRLPEGEYYVDVYGNDEKYHYYNSIVLSSVILTKTQADLYFEASPAYGQNLRIYNGNKLADSDYKMTVSTRSNTEFVNTITALAEEITNGISGDYEKVQAVHDWVAEEIYYDNDYLKDRTLRTNINSISVLNNKFAVCSGYANLTNDLLAASGIPSRQVLGYAIGITDEGDWDDLDMQSLEPNHVWNEAYVDGRWVIIDATWDSSNSYEGEKFTEGDGISQIYFDASMQFFSNTHKIIIP